MAEAQFTYRAERHGLHGGVVGHRDVFGHDTSLFSELVLGCIKASDSEKWRIFSIFFEIYKIFTLSHRSELKISRKFIIFVKI